MTAGNDSCCRSRCHHFGSTILILLLMSFKALQDYARIMASWLTHLQPSFAGIDDGLAV